MPPTTPPAIAPAFELDLCPEPDELVGELPPPEELPPPDELLVDVGLLEIELDG